VTIGIADMSSVLPASPSHAIDPRRAWFPWLPVGLALLAMYVPSYFDLSKVFWKTDIGGHGPLILMVVAWLVWRKRSVLVAGNDTPSSVAGWILLALGAASYAVGRSQGVAQLEIGSQIPLLLGALLVLRGRRTLLALLFPVLFIAFLVPLPGSLLDAILLPLKRYVSIIVESILYGAGYPVARTGVVMTIGPYQLLIADACSGLNSMVALSAVGLLFVYVVASRSIAYNAIMVLAILPVAFLANIVRVTLLMLVTYYFGDGVGQEFHDYAGYIEIVFAFGAYFGLDALLRVFLDRRSPEQEATSRRAAS
jgi:exosortase B